MDLLALHVTFSPMELFFMGLCVLLLLFSRPLLGRIFSEEDEKKRSTLRKARTSGLGATMVPLQTWFLSWSQVKGKACLPRPSSDKSCMPVPKAWKHSPVSQP